jgi:hypothetical protein
LLPGLVGVVVGAPVGDLVGVGVGVGDGVAFCEIVSVIVASRSWEEFGGGDCASTVPVG